VTGTSSNAQFRGGPPPGREFFVYRVLKPASEDDIKDCLYDNDIEYSDVRKISNSDAKFCSFKITVSPKYVANVLNPDIWPQGVRVRRFINNSNTRDGGSQ
jgi:hypothetical protein